MTAVGNIQLKGYKMVALSEGGGKKMMAVHWPEFTTPPKVEHEEILGLQRIWADGEDLGEQDVCCSGSHMVPGGFLSFRWEIR